MKDKAKELIPQVADKIKDHNIIVCNKGEARKEYFECIRETCKVAGKTLVSLGYKMTGDINELSRVNHLVEQGQLVEVSRVESAKSIPNTRAIKT